MPDKTMEDWRAISRLGTKGPKASTAQMDSLDGERQAVFE
jgi:hypothetical protein